MTYVIACLLTLSGVLVFAVEIPAQLDYVNHLARMHLLFDAAHGHPNPFYAVEWKFTLNQACDLIVPQIAEFTGVDIAMKLFLLASQALVVSGAMALEASFKGRPQFAGIFAVIMLYAIPFAWGLVNFAFGVGIALWAIAAWRLLQKNSWSLRCVVHGLFVLALFVSHAFALGLYGLSIGFIELVERRRITEFALMAIPPAMALTAFLFLPHTTGEAMSWDWWLKLKWPFFMMMPLSPWSSALTSVSVIVLFAFLLHRKAIGISQQGKLVVAGMLLTYLAFPRVLFESGISDVRILAMTILILPAFTTFAGSKDLAIFGGASITAIALVSLGLSSVNWWQRQQDFAEMRSSFDKLSPGARVLIAADGPLEAGMIPIYYGPTLAAHYSGAFLPTLYTVKGAQPLVKTISGYDIPNAQDYLPQPWSEIVANEGPAYTRDWRHRYDYVFVFHDKGTLGAAVYRGRNFALYKTN